MQRSFFAMKESHCVIAQWLCVILSLQRNVSVFFLRIGDFLALKTAQAF